VPFAALGRLHFNFTPFRPYVGHSPKKREQKEREHDKRNDGD
jgi:hypothetical protein